MNIRVYVRLIVMKSNLANVPDGCLILCNGEFQAACITISIPTGPTAILHFHLFNGKSILLGKGVSG